MPTIVAEARVAVTTARRRLAAAAAAEGAAAGALYGAAAGVALVLAGLAAPQATANAPTPWLFALPVAVAVAMAARAAARAPSLVGAALALDRAAGTHEAFVSALSAEDAPPAFRELAAENALRRCPRAGVARFLPLVWPRRARGAVVAVALLAAVAVVAGPSDVNASAPGPRSFLPARHALVPAVAGTSREDLREADAARLRAAAEALLASAGYEEAERALAALAAGDRVTALLELERALERASGASTAGARPDTGERGGNDPGGAGQGGRSDGSLAPWAAGSWPLRYDRVVDRWIELERNDEEDR